MDIVNKIRAWLDELLASLRPGYIPPAKYADKITQLTAEADKAEADLAQVTQITNLQKRIVKARTDKARLMGKR